MKNHLIKTATTIGLIAVGLLLTSCSPSPSYIVKPEGEPPIGGGGPVESDGGADPGEASSAGSGSWITYEQYSANPSSYEDSAVVLFFNARWCSSCKTTIANIEADLEGIPPELTIVSVDYDTATELRQRYEVTIQHTFIQINSDGEAVGRWAGSLTTQEILEQVT